MNHVNKITTNCCFVWCWITATVSVPSCATYTARRWFLAFFVGRRLWVYFQLRQGEPFSHIPKTINIRLLADNQITIWSESMVRIPCDRLVTQPGCIPISHLMAVWEWTAINGRWMDAWRDNISSKATWGVLEQIIKEAIMIHRWGFDSSDIQNPATSGHERLIAITVLQICINSLITVNVSQINLNAGQPEAHYNDDF